MFIKADPEATESKLCFSCFEEGNHYSGVIIDNTGVYHAWLCENCRRFSMAENEENPFNEINEKLDKLLRWAGLSH